MTYLMDSPSETDRLLKKSDYGTSKEQLLLTGLKEGMVGIDAGGGAGFVTNIISEIVGPKGRAILIDQSKDRLAAAKKFNEAQKNITYLQSPLEKIEIESNTADYVFCRFVFEYLSDTKIVFNELVRIAKPGAKIVVGDLDYNVLSHYPLSVQLENELREIATELQQKNVWDPYAGRKLYHLFQGASLEGVKIHMIAHHLIYGEPQQRDIENWDAKLNQIQKLHSEGVLKLSFDVKKFRTEFMKFFKDPARFSYSPLFLVEGVKPKN